MDEAFGDTRSAAEHLAEAALLERLANALPDDRPLKADLLKQAGEARLRASMVR